MQLHQLRSIHKTRRPKRIGRGGKKGFTSGKGSKGQRARAGRRFKPLIRDIIKRYPKLRGYRVKERLTKLAIVNLEQLDRVFPAGGTVTPRLLVEKGLVTAWGGKTPLVKILSQGELKKALTFENCRFSSLAREKIVKAGGSVKE